MIQIISNDFLYPAEEKPLKSRTELNDTDKCFHEVSNRNRKMNEHTNSNI